MLELCSVEVNPISFILIESSTDDEMEGSNENNIVRTLLRSIDRYIIEIYNGNNLQILENTNNLRLRVYIYIYILYILIFNN